MASHPVFDRDELYALSSVFSICCNDAFGKFHEAKRLRLPLSVVKETVGDEVETCAMKVFDGTIQHCSDAYEAVKACQAKNKLKECVAFRAALEKCAVKNKLGELE
mmetsp:Transcript_2047/g.2905  ORF Transcript_2047/g.2905 Transcript_2047/m.2905 type:complete len:106 (+) Transcript_2047:50-367(+)|eukprot:CAMPEP_0184862796 /NCGR_PEP_ID=MMETSP0580-20130426/7799_1 /TAXON_ID=1118495 /ORGANISM="Dactyliosolen fragilissimus" /LENGTH=105 /DNA_ID=CAMNT_0027360787 /DNA_START=50 /DNA_END=367 /DNA_ORIENTATION=+